MKPKTNIISPNDQPSNAVLLWRQASEDVMNHDFAGKLSGALWNAVEEAVCDPSNKIDPFLQDTYEYTLTGFAETIHHDVNDTIQRCLKEYEAEIDVCLRTHLLDRLKEQMAIE